MVSYAAIAIAVVAVILSLVIPGPAGLQGPAGATGATGPTGPTGPQGPAGTSVLMAADMIAPWTTGGMPLVGCTNLLNLSLTVSRAGTFVVYGTVHLWIEHTSGTTDTWNAQMATTASDCSSSNATRVGWIGNVPSSWPSVTTVNEDGTFVNAFAVSAAGTYTYYLNANMIAGQSAGDEVSEAAMVMVFYPA